MCVDSERKTNTYKVMKVNAPEKLYFGESDKGILDIYSTKESDNEVEYIRKDAFIEKACEWLKNHSEVDYFELIPDANYCGAGNLNKKND